MSDMVESDSSTTPLRIAIVGGGIVGLMLSALLHARGASFTLYESAARFSEIGAGIMMGWNALKVFHEMGLYDEYVPLARKNWGEGDKGDTFFQYRFGDGRDGGDPFYTLKMPGGQMNTHRAELLELLLGHVPKDCVRFRKQLVAYEQAHDGTITLSFADGLSAEADVLIGADGIKSTVRRLMYTKKGEVGLQEPRWCGSVGYRTLVAKHKFLAAVGSTITNTPMMWLEHSRHLVHYPVASGRSINVVAFKSDYSKGKYQKWEKTDWVDHDVDEQELLNDFDGCGQQVKAILELVEKPSRWAMFEVPDLPYFVQGNVAFMGDAAHAMTPHPGNGASQGIEDAHVLAHLLSHPKITLATVSTALRAYELVRKERVQRVKHLAYETGVLWELTSPVGDDTKEFARVAGERMDWIWGVDVRKQVQTALDWFEMSLAS